MGLPFGGRTPHSQGDMAADTGAIRIEQGPKPTVEESDDEEPELPPATEDRRDAPPGDVDSPPPRRVAESAPGASEGVLEPEPPPPVPETQAAAAERQRRIEAIAREQEALEEAADALRAAFLGDPQLAELARQVLVEIVPEGLRIQLLESDGTPMFATGGSQPTERVRQMIREVARTAARLPNPVTVTGHTDSAPFRGPGRSNWELSAERANAARRLLVDSGVAEARLRGVTGMADREPLLPGQPMAAGNRRVAITLLRQTELPR
jgi:chemotaxis protein MotB